MPFRSFLSPLVAFGFPCYEKYLEVCTVVRMYLISLDNEQLGLFRTFQKSAFHIPPHILEMSKPVYGYTFYG